MANQYLTSSLNQMGGGQSYKPPQQLDQPATPTQQTYEQKAAQYATPQPSRYGIQGSLGAGMFNAMRGSLAESFKLQDLQQGGYDEAAALFRESLPGMMAPTLTDNDISGLYAGRLEAVAQTSARDMEALGEYTGSTGLRGGQAADLAAQVELGRLGQVTRGMRDLRQAQAELESRDKMTQLNTILGGQDILSATSTYAQQSLANMAEIFGGLFGFERGAQAQRDAAVEQRQGALVSGGLNLLGTGAGAFLGR